MPATTLESRPANTIDILAFEEFVRKELAKTEKNFTDKLNERDRSVERRSNLVQWIIGLFVVVLMASSVFLAERIVALDDRVREHHEDHSLHMTAEERRVKEREEDAFREEVRGWIRRWDEDRRNGQRR